MSRSNRHGLPLLAPAQAQKHVTHNEALMQLDVLVNLAVDSRTVVSPPSAPVDGAAWLVPEGASGAWSGRSGAIAARISGAWHYFQPQDGWQVYVMDEAALLVLSERHWRVLARAEELIG